MRYLALLAVLAACGAPDVPQPEPWRLTGDYDGTLTFTEPCDYLPPFITLGLTFTAEGDLKSPALGIDCTTTYPALAEVAFECRGYSIKLVAAGWLAHTGDGGTIAYGRGTIEGVISCEPTRAIRFDIGHL